MRHLRELLLFLPNIVQSMTDVVDWLTTVTLRDVTATGTIIGNILLTNPVGSAFLVWVETSNAPVLDTPFLYLMFGSFVVVYLAYSIIRWILGLFI